MIDTLLRVVRRQKRVRIAISVLQEICDTGHGLPAFLFDYSVELRGKAVLITMRVKIKKIL